MHHATAQQLMFSRMFEEYCKVYTFLFVLLPIPEWSVKSSNLSLSDFYAFSDF